LITIVLFVACEASKQQVKAFQPAQTPEEVVKEESLRLPTGTGAVVDIPTIQRKPLKLSEKDRAIAETPASPLSPIQPLQASEEKEEIPDQLIFQTYYVFNLEDQVVWYGKSTNWWESLEGKAFVETTEVSLEGANYETQIIRVTKANFEFPSQCALSYRGKKYKITFLPQKEQEAGVVYFNPAYVRTTFFADVSYPGATFETPHRTEMSVETLQKMDSFIVSGVRFKAENLFVVSNSKNESCFQMMGLSEKIKLFPIITKEARLEAFDDAGAKLGEITIGNPEKFFVVTYKYFGDFWLPYDNRYEGSPVGSAGVLNGANGSWHNIGLKLDDENNDLMFLQVVAPFKFSTAMTFVTDMGKVWKMSVVDRLPAGDFYKLKPTD